MVNFFLPLQASTFVLSIWTLVGSSLAISSGTPCNGLPEYCNLKVNQFTFPGTHNSGAGFSGSLRRCNGQPQSDCIWRNQGLNISSQLELGIRLLNIDTCLLPDNCADDVYGTLGDSRLFACYGNETDMSLFGYRYAGPILNVLEQVNSWMNGNPNEVIVLHFTDDTPSGEMSAIMNELVRLLERQWGSSMNNELAMNTFFTTNGGWPTLQQAIDSNQRIIVLVDDGLNVNSLSHPWINPSPRSTFVPGTWTGTTCPGLFDSASRCNTSEEFILATGFTLGQCIPEGQMDCNRRLLNATNLCYNYRAEYNQTVNALLVDFPEEADDMNNVFQVTDALNVENLRRYLGIDLLSVDTTTSMVTSGSNTDTNSRTDITYTMSTTDDVIITSGTSKGNEPHKKIVLVNMVIVTFTLVFA